MLKRSALAGSILALGVTGAALAQDKGMDPLSMTCSDIAEMDESRAEGAVYFLAGYEQAQGMDMGAVSGVTGTAATGDTATGTTGTALSGTGTDTAGATTGSGGDMGTSMEFEQLDVAAIVSACEDSPESLVSTVLRDHAAGN